MQVYRNFLRIPDKHRGGVIAIGNFDGVHQGHVKVIETAGKLAREKNIPWGVLTFEPHPVPFLYILIVLNVWNRKHKYFLLAWVRLFVHLTWRTNLQM